MTTFTKGTTFFTDDGYKTSLLHPVGNNTTHNLYFYVILANFLEVVPCGALDSDLCLQGSTPKPRFFFLVSFF